MSLDVIEHLLSIQTKSAKYPLFVYFYVHFCQKKPNFHDFEVLADTLKCTPFF